MESAATEIWEARGWVETTAETLRYTRRCPGELHESEKTNKEPPNTSEGNCSSHAGSKPNSEQRLASVPPGRTPASPRATPPGTSARGREVRLPQPALGQGATSGAAALAGPPPAPHPRLAATRPGRSRGGTRADAHGAPGRPRLTFGPREPPRPGISAPAPRAQPPRAAPRYSRRTARRNWLARGRGAGTLWTHRPTSLCVVARAVIGEPSGVGRVSLPPRVFWA